MSAAAFLAASVQAMQGRLIHELASVSKLDRLRLMNWLTGRSCPHTPHPNNPSLLFATVQPCPIVKASRHQQPVNSNVIALCLVVKLDYRKPYTLNLDDE